VPIVAEYEPPKRRPRRIDQRAAFDAIIFRLRTGCQWNWLPKAYPVGSSVHRKFNAGSVWASSTGFGQ
jgi:putative transposase